MKRYTWVDGGGAICEMGIRKGVARGQGWEGAWGNPMGASLDWLEDDRFSELAEADLMCSLPHQPI